MTRKKEIADFIRIPKTVLMPIDDIEVDKTVPTDEQFIKIYSKYLTGRLVDIRTRVDIETIVPGFFRRDEHGQYESVDLEYPERALETTIWEI